MRLLLTAAFVVLGLAGCTSMPTSPTATTTATDDLGRVRINHDPAWMDRVAVSSDNPELRDRAVELLRKNFSVRIVPPKKAFVFIRLLSCSAEHAVRICLNVQYDGRIVAREQLSQPLKTSCVDRTAQRVLEDMYFRNYETEDRFLDFVDTSFGKLPRRS